MAKRPFERSIYFDDPDGNHLEFCVRRIEPLSECISHTVFETLQHEKGSDFLLRSARHGCAISFGEEMLIPVQTDR